MKSLGHAVYPLMKSTLGLWMLAATAAFGQFADTPHPRLWFPGSADAAVREKIAKDPLAAALHQSALRQADAILKARTCRYEIPDGRRLLRESRLALEQVIHCAWAWRLTGKPEYLQRSVAELEAACAMKDWNPSHFLDTAEMAVAVAIGYDWLHPALTPDQRAMCETAIREKALIPAKAVHDQKGWWTKARNNWAQVCGSGIALAAIAIQGRDHDLSADLIRQSIGLVEKCGHFYQPDGLYPEGPGYWHYGTNYHVMLLAACESLRHPMQAPERLEQSGDSMIHLHGPTLLPFNFADGNPRPSRKSPAQSWIATRYRNADQAMDTRERLRHTLNDAKGSGIFDTTPLHLLWLPAEAQPGQTRAKHAVFHGEQPVACFRTGWDKNATWLAIKAGTSSGGHDHMDVGSFCYDAKGSRWFHDLGADDYNMPGYFGSGRFRYFRLQNRSHNTLEIGGKLQTVGIRSAPILSSSTGGNPATASMDLSPAYADSAQQVIRSVRFDETTGAAILHDEITAPCGEIRWRAITDAAIEINGRSVTLTKNRQSISLRRLSAAGSWSIEELTPPQAIENPNEGFRALVLSVDPESTGAQKNRTSIRVEIRP